MRLWNTATRRGMWLTLLVAVVAFGLYAPTIGYDFAALDDDAFVINNAVVTNGFTLASVKAAWTTAPEANWVPLLWMSFMLDIELHGMDPRGMHLTNVVLFALNAGLLFWLLRRWTGRPGVALAAALLWVCHPTRVESVAWITERKDVLSGLFFLLGVGAYVEGRRDNLPHGMLWAWLGMVIGGLVKQVLIVMPAALLLLDVWPLGRTDWDRIWKDGWRLAAEKWAFWLVAGLLACVPIWVHHEQGSLLEIPLYYRLGMIPIHYLFYLQKLVWPTELMPLQDELSFRWWLWAAGLGVLAAVTWGLWRLRRRHPGALMGWLWLVGLLFPWTGMVWGGAERMATRFMYLPQIGFFLAVAVTADELCRQRGWNPKWNFAAGLLLLAAYGGVTLQLLPNWRDKDSFRGAVWRYNDGHNAACLLGGDYYFNRGDWQKAEEAYAKGTMLNSKSCVGRLCQLRVWYGQAGSAGQIWQAYETTAGMRLLDFNPREGVEDRRILWNVRGAILRAAGDYTGAIDALTKAVELQPDPAAFIVAELLRTCFEAGRPEAGALARARLQAATGLEIREWRDLLPRYLQFWYQGGRGLAFEFFSEHARRHPEDGLALNNMAWLIATAEPDGLNHARQDEWPATALAWAERARELGGAELSGVWDTLAAARANTGDFEGAISAATQAMEQAHQAGEWVLANEIQRRLDGYRAGQPWREKDKRAQKAVEKD